MQKINYDLEMQKLLNSGKPCVLLHVCCAPCSSAVLERISQQAELKLFFYNPNIIPAQEYDYRLQELQRLVQEMPCAEGIEILEGYYHPEKFLAFAEELSEEPERGARCQKCIAMRLEETAKQADVLGADYFATTLTLSPHKDALFINTAGFAIAEQYAVNWLPSDFKKKNGYLRSIQLSKEYCLYRQDFCGCPFSRKQREQQKQASPEA